LTGGDPKLNEKVGAEADELEAWFGWAVLADDEVALDLLALFFAFSERAWLSFLRCVLANEFKAINASVT
jgi:hypothetical protein